VPAGFIDQFLRVLEKSTISTTVYLRRLHNTALDLNWLPCPVMPRPAPPMHTRRFITEFSSTNESPTMVRLQGGFAHAGIAESGRFETLALDCRLTYQAIRRAAPMLAKLK